MRQPVLVHLSGRLDASTAHEWRQTLAGAAGNDLALDLGDVTYVDASFVAALLRIEDGGCDITITACQPYVGFVLLLGLGADADDDTGGGAEVIPLPLPSVEVPARVAGGEVGPAPLR